MRDRRFGRIADRDPQVVEGGHPGKSVVEAISDLNDPHV